MSSNATKKFLFYGGGAYVFGAEIATLNLMTELRSRGHDVRCVVNGWNDGEFIARLQAAGIRCDAVRLGFIYISKPSWTWQTLIHYPRALATCARIHAEYEPDVVCHAGYRTVLMLPSFGRRHLTVMHVHEAEPGNFKTRLLYGLASRRVDKFIANSEFIRGRLATYGVPVDRIVVAHPQIRIDGYPSGPNTHRPSRCPRIGIVGQIVPLKGHAELLRALAIVQASGLEFTLEVYGRGPESWTSELARMAHELGVEQRVHWHGFVADRGAVYGNLDLVVVPTREEEAFGMVAAESALWGLPVVASASGGLPEIVIDEQTGCLFRSGDVEDLAAKLTRLLRDPAACVRFGAAAREYVEDRFSPRRCIAAFESALD